MPQITIELSELLAATGINAPASSQSMIGKHVIVRCRDAGVHAGVLTERQGRECTLAESRRLWYWKPANGAAFLSGVAVEGLHPDSKVGAPVTITLTENCEIIECTEQAAASIREAKSYDPS